MKWKWKNMAKAITWTLASTKMEPTYAQKSTGNQQQRTQLSTRTPQDKYNTVKQKRLQNGTKHSQRNIKQITVMSHTKRHTKSN